MNKAIFILASATLIFLSSHLYAQDIDTHVVRQKEIQTTAIQQLLRPQFSVSPSNPAATVDSDIALQLFDGSTIVLVESKIEQRDANNYSWFGSVQGHPGSVAILVVADEKITGQIEFAGKWYEINPSSNGTHQLSEIDATQLPSLENDVLEPHQSALEPPNFSAIFPSSPTTAEFVNGFNGELNAEAETINILAIYSIEAANAYPDVEARIQLAVDYTNMAYENSLISHRVNLVAAVAVDHEESGINAEIFDISNLFDGKLDEVHALREQYNADVISFWANYISGLCGQANAILSSAFSASHILRVSCGARTFAHELGHNQGARHNIEEDSSTRPFAYGHGAGSVANGWRTIMSYSSACGANCAAIPYFSSPLAMYQGEPVGDIDLRDNARVINETGSLVASFGDTFYPAGNTSVILQNTTGEEQIALEPLAPGQWIGHTTYEAGKFYRWNLLVDGVVYGPQDPPLTLGENVSGIFSPDSSNNTLLTRSFGTPELTVLYDERYRYMWIKATSLLHPQLLLRGTGNNFGTDNVMQHLGFNQWVGTMTFEGAVNDRFKFDVHGDWSENYGFGPDGETLVLGGNDILVPEAGTYRIYADLVNKVTWMRRVEAPGNLPPQANAGPDQTVTIGETVSLDGSASFDPDGDIAAYEWLELGANEASTSTSFSTAGTYTLTLRVTDNDGANASDTVEIEVVNPGARQRTIVFIFGETDQGQDMFIRGGLDHNYAQTVLGRTCTAANYACAIPITHRNLLNNTTAQWKNNDSYLDWYGLEQGQVGGEGTPMDWTINQWPSDWGPIKTVPIDGFGESSLNLWGAHYWMLDVDMECSATADGWFELKSFISNGPGWEANVSQPNAPWQSGNHFAECGKMNVFIRGQSNPVTITEIP